jgi:hypothetical protein
VAQQNAALGVLPHFVQLHAQRQAVRRLEIVVSAWQSACTDLPWKAISVEKLDLFEERFSVREGSIQAGITGR